MNDAGFLVFVIVSLGAVLFFVSPRAFRHWSVLMFVVLAFVIVLVGLPYKFALFVVLAVVLWVAGMYIDRHA